MRLGAVRQRRCSSDDPALQFLRKRQTTSRAARSSGSSASSSRIRSAHASSGLTEGLTVYSPLEEVGNTVQVVRERAGTEAKMAPGGERSRASPRRRHSGPRPHEQATCLSIPNSLRAPTSRRSIASAYHYSKHSQTTLQREVGAQLDGVPHIDRIAFRAKAPDSYIVKVYDRRIDPPYAAPLLEVEDQVAGRVTVFFLDDVDVVLGRLRRLFGEVELAERRPEKVTEFDYEGFHAVYNIPPHCKSSNWTIEMTSQQPPNSRADALPARLGRATARHRIQADRRTDLRRTEGSCLGRSELLGCRPRIQPSLETGRRAHDGNRLTETLLA